MPRPGGKGHDSMARKGVKGGWADSNRALEESRDSNSSNSTSASTSVTAPLVSLRKPKLTVCLLFISPHKFSIYDAVSLFKVTDATVLFLGIAQR
jgi:hypothetical protein